LLVFVFMAMELCSIRSGLTFCETLFLLPPAGYWFWVLFDSMILG
jgi:hypothetical protein